MAIGQEDEGVGGLGAGLRAEHGKDGLVEPGGGPGGGEVQHGLGDRQGVGAEFEQTQSRVQRQAIRPDRPCLDQQVLGGIEPRGPIDIALLHTARSVNTDERHPGF